MDNLLCKIQQELKAPKGQYNSFGKYKYRSCEDIVEAVKPILAKLDLALVLNDEVVCLGDRFYIKAEAIITGSKGVVASAFGFAREPLAKKGMDESQITGTSSSYARKYALNGLLAIDDTKDADTDQHHNQVEQKTPRINKKQMQEAVRLILEHIEADDALGVKEVVGELKDYEQEFIWSQFDTAQKSKIKSMMFTVKDSE